MNSNKSPVIDVDSHWTFDWEYDLADGPLKKYASRFGDTPELLTFYMGADLLRSLPRAEWPEPSNFFSSERHPDGRVRVPDFWEPLRCESSAAKRVEWMDRTGIDYGLVNPGAYTSLFVRLEDLAERQAFLRECNDVLADAVAEQSARLGAIAYLDVQDMDWAVGELKRMRDRGSRAFVVRTEPVNGFSPGHSHWNRLWAAAEELGMIVTFHIGVAPSWFGDFARIDWEKASPDWPGLFLRMSNSQNHQGPELFLNAMLFGGVFERFPNLTVLNAELWTGWLPNLVRKADALCQKDVHGGIWGPWPYSISGGEMLRRNVRVTPLPGLGDWDPLGVLRDFPEMVVFSSDYPHTEGNADPINLYRPELDELPDELRRDFLGANIAHCYERMGDPVV